MRPSCEQSHHRSKAALARRCRCMERRPASADVPLRRNRVRKRAPSHQSVAGPGVPSRRRQQQGRGPSSHTARKDTLGLFLLLNCGRGRAASGARKPRGRAVGSGQRGRRYAPHDGALVWDLRRSSGRASAAAAAAAAAAACQTSSNRKRRHGGPQRRLTRQSRLCSSAQLAHGGYALTRTRLQAGGLRLTATSRTAEGASEPKRLYRRTWWSQRRPALCCNAPGSSTSSARTATGSRCCAITGAMRSLKLGGGCS
mmetsp:Transcript_10074/g.39236  ORF Transcript_10074/g.39236 Transcript_10074/m.39236 type:complete len:256 (+) Transcript_10074:1527-2294(+)